MAAAVTQTFIPGPRLVDGSDLANLVAQINAANASGGVEAMILPIPGLSSLANAQVYKLVVPYAFKVIAVGFRVNAAASTAAKLATCTAQVNGVAVTGGVVALTTANCNAIGNAVAGSAITGANVGTANQTVEVAISAVTAFVEGGGYFEFTILNAAIQ